MNPKLFAEQSRTTTHANAVVMSRPEESSFWSGKKSSVGINLPWIRPADEAQYSVSGYFSYSGVRT